MVVCLLFLIRKIHQSSFQGSLLRTNDENCPITLEPNAAYADLTVKDCQQHCLSNQTCMAYRWKLQKKDQNTFNSCHIWTWDEKKNCKEIIQCQGLSGEQEETCLITEDARIFIKSDKCDLNISVYHFHNFI